MDNQCPLVDTQWLFGGKDRWFEIGRETKFEQFFHRPAISGTNRAGPVFGHGPATSATGKLYAAGAAFGNGGYIAAFPGIYQFLPARNFGVKCSQRFISFAHRSGAGINMPGVIEGPFGFAGRAGIE